MNPTFDKEKIYDEQINPLVAQIIGICKEHGIPMLATFNYKRSPEAEENNVSFCTTVLGYRDGWQPPEIKEAAHIIRSGAVSRPKLMAFTVTGAPI